MLIDGTQVSLLENIAQRSSCHRSTDECADTVDAAVDSTDADDVAAAVDAGADAAVAVDDGARC